MKLYHLSVEREDGWFIGRVLEREGITTQGRSLDELVVMAREAIGLMWNESGVDLELIVPGEAQVLKRSRRVGTGRQSRRPKRAAARP